MGTGNHHIRYQVHILLGIVLLGGGIFLSPAHGVTTALSFKESNKEILHQYMTNLDRYRRQYCPASVRRRFHQLYRSYQHEGFYIPWTPSREVDLESIKVSLGPLKEKSNWIQGLTQQTPRGRRFPRHSPTLKPLWEQLDLVLEYKKKNRLAHSEDQRATLRRASKKALKELSRRFDKMTQKVFFLLGFHYPIDHFKFRRQYEVVRQNEGPRKNQLYMERKLYEDGAPNKKGLTDIYIRTTLNTLKLRLSQPTDFLHEDIRYDLDWVLKMIRLELKKGSRYQIQKLSRWNKKIRGQVDLYERLLRQKGSPELAQRAKDRAQTTDKLKKFVYSRQAQLYKYFSTKPEVDQALLALDQVLLNELGEATALNFRDRRDVAQVVINRRWNPSYSTLNPHDNLRPYLRKLGVKPQFPWLNTLFKEAEFSFHLHYMIASEHSFCPDFYRLAQKTRKKNILLALKQLKSPDLSFPALRYFSRFSMVGKIDMAPIWSDFEPLPESAGRRIRHDKKLRRAFNKNHYQYLYQFKDESHQNFDVIQINDDIYSVLNYPKAPKFFNYRDPNKIQFFQPKSSSNIKK